MADSGKRDELKKTVEDMKLLTKAFGDRQGREVGNGAEKAEASAIVRAGRTVLGNGRATKWTYNVPKYKAAKKFCELVLQGWGRTDILELMGFTSDAYRTAMQRYRAYLLQEIAKRKTDLIGDGILKINDRISEKLKEIEEHPEKDKRDLGFWIKTRHELTKDLGGSGRETKSRNLVVVIDTEEEAPKAIEAQCEVKEEKKDDGVQTAQVPVENTEKQE